MLTDTPTVSQLSHVISQAAAPAFLLGALAAFIAVLISRLNRVIDRTIVLNGISDDDTVRYRLKADLPRLMRRAVMLNRAIFWAVIGSISVTVLVVVAFASALLQVQQRIERGDPNAKQFYPQLITLSGNPETEFRLTVAWLTNPVMPLTTMLAG